MFTYGFLIGCMVGAFIMMFCMCLMIVSRGSSYDERLS
ncbi:MAG: DUF3789 domain-containing protein [Syntrophomonadales bacterium]|jgi:hypothetical protein